MALLRAALLAASLGSGVVFALPHEGSSSRPASFSVYVAHTESKQPALLTPHTTTTEHTATLHAPLLETPQSHLSVAPNAPTPNINVPHTESHQNHLDVPTSEAPAHGHTDLRRSTSDVGAVPDTLDQHHVSGGGDTPYTPSGETTLYVAGTPVVTGPAGTAIIVHGTPVMAGLPAAVVDGTTYALEAGGSTLWKNGHPEPLASPTPWSRTPDGVPHYPEPTHATWHTTPTTHETHWPNEHQTTWTHATPHPTTEVAKPTTKSPLEKPSEKPSPPSTSSMTWTGPGLTTETGLGSDAVNLIPGLTLAMFCFVATLI